MSASRENTDKRKPAGGGKRRVSFPPPSFDGGQAGDGATLLSTVVAIIPHREDFTPEEMEALYFTRDEYQASRNAAKAASWECERRGHSKCLDDTFREKDSDAQEKLNQWVTTGSSASTSTTNALVLAAAAASSSASSSAHSTDCRRGLERWSNSDHGEARNHAQFHAIMAVLRAQDDQLSSSTRRHHHPQSHNSNKKELDWDKLRKVSCRATKVSRHFARMIGKADSYAVGQELKLLQQQSSSTTSMSLGNASDHTTSRPRGHDEQQDAVSEPVSLRRLSVQEQLDEEEEASTSIELASKDEETKQHDAPDKVPNLPRGVGGRLFNFKRRKDAAFASRVA